MPAYVYGCSNKSHPRIEVTHPIGEEPILRCAECGEFLCRIPQRFLWGADPFSLIQAWSERNWSKKLRGEPREQAYDSVATDRGKPQKDFAKR